MNESAMNAVSMERQVAALHSSSKDSTEEKYGMERTVAFTQVNQFEKSLKSVLFLTFCFIKKRRDSTQLGKGRYLKFHCLNIFSENKLLLVIQVT